VSDGRTAVVTGAGTGIGAAAAELLAAHGIAVALVGRRHRPLAAVAERILEVGGRSLVVPADLSSPDAPIEVVERTIGAFGQLDVVVNNAAFIRTGSLDDASPALVDEHYATNVRGPLLLVRAALPHLRRSACPAVVNVSSSVGSIVKPGNMLYGSTKATLEYLTRAWAYELARDGIRVNCVAPGPVDTPIHATYADDLAATYADLARRIPLGRMGAPADVAVWIWHLVAPDTTWTTGNVVHVDGGQVLGVPE